MLSHKPNRKKKMKIEQGTKFVVSYIPEKINGQENTKTEVVRRTAVFDEKSRVFTTTKGETALVYFDVERNGYRTAKNFIITLKG